MRIILELLRIIVLFGLLGTLGGILIANIYAIDESTKSFSWLGTASIFVLLFVLYRNKLQFSGWYKGVGRKRLPRKVSVTLISVSFVMLLSPFILGYLFN